MLFEIRAHIGTALTPALPISGFIFLCLGRKMFMNFTKRIPVDEAMMNAKAPRRNMNTVFIVKNSLACVEHPTVRPRRTTTTSLRALPAVFANRVVLPDSLRRFPKKSIPRSGRPDGTMKVVSSNPMIGNMILSNWLTLLAGCIRICLSFFVVRRRINGGWITGTSAIYEYAHTAIAPIRLGLSLEDRKIAVGPSAPPIMAMPAAWLGSKPRAKAII